MKTINVAEAAGPALDWLVAKCEEVELNHIERSKAGGVWLWLDMDENGRYVLYTPSTDWSQGGPIKEERGIGTLFNAGSACRKPCWFATPDDQQVSTSYEGESFDPCYMVNEEPGQYGPTELIAAMRCRVASQLGPTAEVPEELL